MSIIPTAALASLVQGVNYRLHINPVDKLPAELTEQIFKSLGPNDLVRCSMTSRKWREQVLDSSLWKLMFGREGWLCDSEEVKETTQSEASRRENALQPSRHKSHRRKPDSDIQGNGSRKRQRESLAVGASNLQPADTSSWSEQHGSIEADEDHAMQGIESPALDYPTAADVNGLSPLSTTTEPTGSTPHIPLSKDALDQQEALSHLTPPIQPGLFDTTVQSAKINWLYLYKQRRRLEKNWDNGRYSTFQLPHPDHPEEAHDECVYAVQYSGNYLVSGSRDKTIKIWDLNTQRCIRHLKGGHDQSVLCLQFDEKDDIVVSGGSDSYVIIWKFSTGEIIKKMTTAHTESVLNLRFDYRYLITCSKDKTIKLWNRHELSANDPIVPTCAVEQFTAAGFGTSLPPLPPYSLLLTLQGHNAAVNAIQIHEGQIVSASGDRTIRAWDLNTGLCIREYSGHTKGIACVQFDGRRIISGSSDNTVRIFDVATSAEVACLSGHTNLVRTVQARFGDSLDSEEDLEATARAIDRNFQEAVDNGQVPRNPPPGAPRNAGSSNPRDVNAIGAKIPPGGGGNKWSRIVSGSYDETVIIWKKDYQGKWVANRRLGQNEILNNPRNQRPRQPRINPIHHLQHLHAQAQQAQAQQAQQQQQGATQAGGAGAPNQAPNAAALAAAHQQAPAAASNPDVAHGAQQAQHTAVGPAGAVQGPLNQVQAALVSPEVRNMGRDDTNRVFKLQFDSRRIVCCSQNRIIVGWDFANNDPELEEASRFFAETD